MGVLVRERNWPFECSEGIGDPVCEWTGATTLVSGGLSSRDFLHKDEELAITYSGNTRIFYACAHTHIHTYPL